MSIDCQFNNMLLDEMLASQKVQARIEGSTILGEEYTDIDRVLYADAAVSINKYDVVGSEVECDGTVKFYIVYVDAEEEMGRAEVLCRFVQRIPLNGVSDKDDMNVTADTFDIMCKLSGERQLSVQCAVELQAIANRRKTVNCVSGINKNVQTLMKQNTNMIINSHAKGECSIREEVELNGRVPNAVRVLSNDPYVIIKEVKCADDTVFIDGDLVVYTVLSTQDEYEPCVQTVNTFPLNQSLKAEGTSAGNTALAKSSVKDCFVRLMENAMGEKRIIQYEIVLDLNAVSYEAQNINCVEDVYSVEEQIDYTTDKQKILKEITSNNFTSVVRSELSLAEGKPEMAKICAVSVKPFIIDTEKAEDKTRIAGIIDYNVVYVAVDDGKMNAFSGEQPFEVFTDNVIMAGELEAEACIESISFAMQSAVSLEVKLNIRFEIISKEMTENAVIKEIKAGEAYEKNQPAIRICIIRQGERLWDVGKRMHISVKDLKACNPDLSDYPQADSRITVYNHLAK